MKKLSSIVIFSISLVGTLVIAACATPAGTAAEDMSAEQHRAAATAATAETDRAERSTTSFEPRGNDAHGLVDSMYGTDVYDLGAAPRDAHQSMAAAHASAAQELESFEHEQCAAFPTQTRTRCPLLGTVKVATPIENGVQLELFPGVNREAVVAHVKCHHAFARSQGFEGMPSCPLYLRGLHVEESETGVVITTDKPEVVDDLRARSLSHAAEPRG